MYGETHEIFSREFFCLPDMVPIRDIYYLQIFSNIGYLRTYVCMRVVQCLHVM